MFSGLGSKQIKTVWPWDQFKTTYLIMYNFPWRVAFPAPRGKRGWKSFYAMLKGMVLYLQKVNIWTTLPSSHSSNGAYSWNKTIHQRLKNKGGESPDAWSEALLWLADRMSTVQSESWRRRMWRMLCLSTILWPWEQLITARDPTSSTWERPTGECFSSRQRKMISSQSTL